jgi:ABC-type sugar transport system substrate-binding protein/predicted Ser/Thr protein kinase
MQVDSLIGRQVDDYLIEERIGRGGMSTVYRAFQQTMRRAVALKVITLDPNMEQRDEFRSRFDREAAVVAKLEHLHIMPVYGYGLVGDDMAYMAMRLLRGGTLMQKIGGQPLPLVQTVHIFNQVASGLSYAHQQGIIHRDLKPSNILFDDQQNAYLADFGLARLVEASQHITQSGSVVGTPMYMSPEQLRADPVDARSDVYGMGVLLYQMLTGQPPFAASDGNLVAIIYQHLEKQPRLPSEINANISPEVDSVVLTALAKQPDDRFQTMEAMALALQSAVERTADLAEPISWVSLRSAAGENLSTQPGLARPVSTQTRQASARPALRTALLAGLVLLLAVGAGLVALWQRPPSNPVFEAIVLEGETGVMADAQPSPEEISRAQARVGEAGFIAYITCNTSSEYHATQTREIGDMFAEYGLNYRSYDPDSDAARQSPLVERARLDGADGVIVCPLDPDALAGVLQAAAEARMPLVLLNGTMENYGGVLIAGDEYRMGLEAGRAAGQIIRDERGGQARVIILDYPSLPQIIIRADGLEAGLLEFAPQAEIIGRYLGATQENAERSVQRLLDGQVDFDVILSINDSGSFGAIAALANAGISPNAVIVSSIDAEVLAREYIRRGYFMRASVEVLRADFSRASVDTMIRLLAGGTIPEKILVPPGGVISREVLRADALSN